LVTLKFVHEHLSTDADIIRLFLREARLSSQIRHPNVVRVEDVGRCGDSYFIAMEYVHGVSLAELLACVRRRGERLSTAVVIWLTTQIAEALHAAHEAKAENGAPLGIVHHDVSPENVLVSDTGHIKLIDFGIAKSRAEADERHGRAVLGKLRYMAPEQLLKEPADRRADVYALGVMLWEMLTGRKLLRCVRLDDSRDWSIRAAPPLPSQFCAGLSCELDQAVHKAIKYSPNERYSDALQFRSALLCAELEATRLDAPRVSQILSPLLSAAMNHTDNLALGWSEPTSPARGTARRAPTQGCTQPAAATLGWPYPQSALRQPGLR
jgi:serine/threonine-protein kinase